ncbi:MAG: hypothetical protein HOV79_27065 [Hamadaea sp.]|nr:hypothetical protein [Hamadaea sp.]
MPDARTVPDPPAGPALEIACDESGYEGERLIGTTTDVFAHASLRIGHDDATACILELRRRIRSPATEYKAGNILRAKHRATLRWLLGRDGPLPGAAHVFLIDKRWYVLTKLADLLLEGAPDAATLHRLGPAAYGDLWETFLEAANDLLRVKDQPDVPEELMRVTGLLLERASGPGPLRDLLTAVAQTRPKAELFRAWLLGDPVTNSVVDPLLPAIERVLDRWGTADRPVVIAHHRQTTLSEQRLAQLSGRAEFGGLRHADSFTDMRVQLADLVAGAARKLAADELNGRAEPELTDLLRPYADPASIWGDQRSAERLGIRGTA